MKRIFRILGLLLILVVGQLGATVIQSGSSDLEGTTSWLYDYSSLGNGDTTFLNNTVYKATFSFDVTDNHDSYFIYLGTDNDSDGEYLDDQSDWGTYVKSGIFSGAQTISAFAYYYTLDDHNADYSKDGKKLKFFVRRRGIIDSDTDTLELSGIYEWHLAPPQSPGTPDLQTNDDKGTANNDDETNLTTLNFDVSNLIVSGSNYEVQLVDEYSYNWHWRSGNSTALTPLTITTSATMTFQYDSFTHGYWYLRVNVKNQYGSISYSGNRTVFVDTQTPNPPNILDLLTSSDSGSNSSDNITNDETPTFTVSPSSGSIYGDDVTRIYFSGTYVTLTDSIINSGCPGCTYSSYDFTVETGELTTDNVYQVYAKFADDAGNVSSASDSLTFTLDTTAPNEPDKPDLSTSDDTGFLSGDNVTNLGTNADDIDITITGLSDNDIDSVLLVMDNTDTLGRVELGVGNTSYTFTVNGLTEADHTFKALVKDNAGNQSADSQGLTVTIDTTASGRPTLDLKSSSDNGRLNNDNLTNDDTPTMTTGNLVSSDSVVFYDNGTRLEAFLVNAATMDIVLSQLSDGSHPLTTKAEDPAGNFSLVSTPVVNVRIDTEAPSQPARPNLKDASDTGHANDDEYTSDTTPEFTIGTVAAIDSIVLKIAGQEIEGVPTGSSIDLEVPIAISPDGNYSAYATKIDSAGNSTDGSSLTITIDTADPSTPGKPDLTNATDTGRENDDNKTMEMRPVFTVSNISIGDSLYLKFRDSSGDTTIYARAKADATDETLTAASDVAEGTYNVWVLANDPAGNQTEGTVLSSVEIDTTPPAQIGTTPDLEDASDTGFLDNDNLTADRTPSFDITSVTDADSILLYFDNTIVASSMVPGGATNVVLTASQQNAGTYSRWVKAKRVDVVGNTSAASDSIKLRIDTDKPSIPSLSGLLPSSDTGFLNSDGYTSDDTPSLIVTNVESIDSIIVTIDGTSNDYSRRTIVSQAGTDTLTTITTLADDVYQLTAVAKDSAGNISSTSGILRVTIDTEPTDPTLTGLAIDLTGVSDTGTENNDDLTNDLTPTFQITNATVSDSLYIVAEDALLNTDTVDGEIANSATVSMTSQNLTSLSNITYSDGSYKFYIFPKDSAGNVPSSSLWPFISVEFDTTSPVASGITVDLLGTDDSGRDSTDNLTSELQPTFQISGVSDQDSVYLVAGTDTVDRDEAASNTITLTPSSNLPENPSLSVKALARDYAGNLSNASTILSVVTDTTAPNQPNPANLHENYDTGFYSDDDTTNSTTLGFVIGGLVDGDSITFYLNDVQKSFTAMGGYTAPNASGGEVGLLHTPSAPGLLSIKSTVTDSAGNTSAFSDVMTVKLDLVPPGKPGQPDLIDASDTGTSNSDDVTNDLTPTFQIAGVVAGDSVFVIVSNGGESDTTGADFATDDTIQITIDNLTSDNVTADVGIFSFTAFAVDSAGNTSPSVSSALSVTIDTTAPDPPTISLRAGDDSGVLDDDQLTNVMNPSFNVWGADGEDSLYIAAGSDTVYRGIPDESPDIIPTDSTTEGTVIYTALLRDKAGNLSLASADYEVEIDTTQPFAPSPPDLLPASDTGFANDDDITNNTQPSFILTGLSAGTIDSVLILFDGSIVGSRWVSQPLIDTLQIDPQTFNPVEIFDVSVMAIDSAGNVSDTSGTLTVIIDTDIPTAPSDPDLIATSDLGESSTDNITSDNTPTIFLDNLESGSINKLYWVDSSGDTTDNPLEGTVAVGEDSISLTPTSPLGDGTYTIFYSTEDTAGNVVESADLAPVLVIDTQEPTAVISLTDSLVRFEDPSDTVRVTFSEGMSDPPRISVRYAGGGVLDTSDMTTVFDSVWFYVLEDIPDSNDGAATISITTTDNAGNVLDSLDVTGRTLLRLDNTDPVFSQITPDSGSFVNDTRVAYTITEHTNNPNRLFSSTFTWTPIGAGTTVQAVLDSLELAVGSHALDTLSADPQLEDGTLYTLTITSQDSAGNTGLTVVDSVTYDTTGPIVDSLVYSKNPAMLGDTVEVKAYFNEIVPSAPSFTTMWPGVGAGGPFTMDSTVNGEMLVWLKTDVVVPDIISVSGNVEVTPIAQDRATNPIDSLAGMSILYDTTWVIDVDVPTCSLTYTNIDQPTMSNLGKGGDEILITAKFSEQMKGLNDNIPRLSIIFPDTSDHTMEGIPFTSSSNGDTIWTYSFDLPSDSSYTGFMTVRLASYDLAGNLVEDVVDTNVFEIDNIPPAPFATGTVTPMGRMPKEGWFNEKTDSVAITSPMDPNDPSLVDGKMQVRAVIEGILDSVNVGAPSIINNISVPKTVYIHKDTIRNAILDSSDFDQGARLLTWVELFDLVGNSTVGTISSDTLIIDTIPPVMGSWTGGIVVSSDTVISSDSLSAIWTGFIDNVADGESGINYYNWAVGRFGSSELDSVMAWTSVTDTLVDTLLPLRHQEIYNISVLAQDFAGNISDTLETDAPGILRLNSAPELVAVDSQYVDEDVQFTYQMIGTDVDTATLLGDTLHYSFIDTEGVWLNPFSIGEYSGFIDWSTPTQADTGVYNWNVRVTDEWGFSDTTAIILTVNSVNDTPQVSQIPDITFAEDDINGDTLRLHPYVTDVDNDSTEILWVAVVMPDTNEYPSYPNFFFGPGSTPELEKIIRSWVLTNKRTKKEFSLFGKSRTYSRSSGDTTLAVNIDTINGSVYAYFIADSNYYVDGREVIFVAADPLGLADSTNITVTISPLNDPPVLTVMLDTLMAENDTLTLSLRAIDIDDSVVTFQVLPDSSQMVVVLNDSLATFIPERFWVDSTSVLVIVSDEEYSDSTQFQLRVVRVPRPSLALAIGQNATFTRYFEFIVTDTAEKALDVSLTIQQTGEQVPLDTVGDFTWVGHHSFDTTMTYDFVMYGGAKVGDTTVTRSSALALARARMGWIASSSDGKFQIIGTAGAVSYDYPFMIVDSLLFSVYDNSGGLYRMGHPLLSFEKPVMITLAADTAFVAEEQALYIKSDEEVWQELPTISMNGTLMAWSSKMGYFKIGKKTLFIPEYTSIHQNYPNPFNSQTHFIYDIGFFGGPDQKINFVIYNLLGQEVYRVAKGHAEIGRHEFIWNGTDTFGIPVSSGIYIARLTTNAGFRASKKLMLMK